MVKRFLRLDLSPNGADFETVALEPGLPMLDKTNAHFRVLQRWLGRCVAEPEWHGRSVDLFVCDDQEGRILDVSCEPITDTDLQRNRDLKQDYNELLTRLKSAKPQPDEAKFYEAIIRHARETLTDSGSEEKECHLFKYRVGSVWRLVWGWGYRRKDLEPGKPRVCTNPECNQLYFVRDSADSRDCPQCVTRAGAGTKRSRLGLRTWVLLALVALIAGGLGYFFRGRDDGIGGSGGGHQLVLQATPEKWTGPAGSQIHYAVTHHADNDGEEDVTTQVIAVAEDPKVVEVDDVRGLARARSRGKTAVHFYYGSEDAHATVEVVPLGNPKALLIEPAEVVLGVGTTASLKVIGKYDEGRESDLTSAIEWEPVGSGSVYCYRGQLEGVVPGEAILVARYRATPDDDYLVQQIKVTVVDEEYTSLELLIAPPSLLEGKAARLDAFVTTADNKKRSVINSSLLDLEISPPQMATIDGEYLCSHCIGEGKLKATFDDSDALRDEQTFDVRKDTGPGIFEVTPRELRMARGEVAQLQVTSSTNDPIRLETSDPAVVELLPQHRVAARSTGTAEIVVRQGAREKRVVATVEGVEPTSIAFVPDRISVPVDGSVALRLVARYGDDKEFDLLPDQITSWSKVPAPGIAELDMETLELHGRAPTDTIPQQLEACVGELRATARVDVVVRPVQVELRPNGPVSLHVGEVAELQALAKYGDGHRAELAPAKVSWKVEPSGIEGVSVDPETGTVRASKGGVGPVRVTASYLGFDSNAVELRTVEEPVTLVLKQDRSVILPNHSGQFEVFAADGNSTNLRLEGARFASSDESVLAVDSRSGEYRALKPGQVTVTASHPNAQTPAEEGVTVFSPEEASLVLLPAEINLVEGSRQPLTLELVAGDVREAVSLVGGSDSARMEIPDSGNLDWEPPVLIGTSAGGPFDVRAHYGTMTVGATVRVTKSDPSQLKIRVSPAAVDLVPGQSVAPRVEQWVPGTDEWQEIRPTEINWSVPSSVLWIPPDSGLRPSLTVEESATGSVELTAEHAGATATLTINVKETPPGPGVLSVLREPEGEWLPVGRRQRYTVMVGSGENREPAVGVQWRAPFENDFVRWDPPLLIAKREGYTQELEATVLDQPLKWATRIVAPNVAPPDEQPTDIPDQIRIVTDHTQPIKIPVQANFSDFRVEGIYASGAVRDVTRWAALRVDSDDPQNVPLSVRSGTLHTDKPGTATVQAEYRGISTTEGLRIEVIGELKVDSLEIQPSSMALRVADTRALRVFGVSGTGDNRRLIGDVTNHPELQWSNDAPDVVQLVGPNVTGLEAGDAKVTVTAGDASGSASISVEPGNVDIHKIIIQPTQISLQVGETMWLGTDVTMSQDGNNVGEHFTATSSNPSIVSYNPRNRSISGVSEGEADLHVAVGAARERVHVFVRPPVDLDSGTIVIEPSTGSLAVGEAQDLHVILETDDGRHIDRTSSAILQAGDRNVLAVRGTRIVGLAPGMCEVTASLPGITSAGRAVFVVEDVDFTAIEISPPSMHLAWGEERPIRIYGNGPSGRRDLTYHPDIRVNYGGNTPDAIQWQAGTATVRGAAPGEAELRVTWRDLVADPVPIEVSGTPPTELQIEPRQATTEVGGRIPFVVFATQGNRQRNLTADDGVELQVADTSVARRSRDLTLVGTGVGTTEVAARYGSLSAVAILHVGPESGPPPGWTGLRFLPDILSLQLGVPGASVRVVRVSADGHQEDVDHRANIQVADPDIVDVSWTASGPVFVAKKPGHTQAVANQGNLTTSMPLQILVIDPSEDDDRNARLEVQPDPVRIQAGDTDEFRRVRVVPGNATAPFDVDYRVRSGDENIVTVEGGKILRGRSPGRARVVVAPVGAEEPFEDLSASVTVEVVAPGGGARRLVLSGPSRVMVGTAPQYSAQLVGGPVARDVSSDGAQLVVASDQESLAEVQPGCSLAARNPGTLNLRARYNDLISDPLQVHISQPGVYERLELELGARTMAVDESRSYRVWGYPVGNGPRQDLTGRVVAHPAPAAPGSPQVAVRVTEPEGGDIVSHAPPTLVGKSPGKFRVVASLPPDLRSEIVDVEIVDRPPSGIGLRAIPRSLTLRVGETTPRIRTQLRSRNSGASRDVRVAWSSGNETILAKSPEIPDRFVARNAGQTQLTATYRDFTALVDVTIVPGGDPFHRVSMREEPEWKPNNSFAVTVDIESSKSYSGLKYRLSSVGNPEGGQWVEATSGAESVKATLTSPDIRKGRDGERYHLRIDARDESGKTVASYPLSFELTREKTKVKPSGPTSPSGSDR